MDSKPKSWRIGPVVLNVVEGDLFELPVDAIVNSEQTDFVLSGVPSTVSGQLFLRFGPKLQEELDRQARGRILEPGTVLKTSGFGRYRQIYHAGFHRPDEWLEEDERELQEADTLQTIRRCVRAILGDLETGSISSVAFPMIGTGLFSLDPRLMAYEFAREVVDHALRGGPPGREVWLATRGKLHHELLEPLVQGVIDGLYGITGLNDLELGIGYLDRFNRRQVRAGDPRFRAWMLIRYAELLLEYTLFRLASKMQPPCRVEEILSMGRGLSFGLVRAEAQVLALKWEQAEAPNDPWGRFLAERLLDDQRVHHRLLQFTTDRNNLAHGRAARPADAIEEDLQGFVDVHQWHARRSRSGDPGEADLGPWLRAAAAPLSPALGGETPIYGVLERWTTHEYEYLIPETGQTFRAPRKGASTC